MTETEITLRALTARSRLSPEERRKLERDADAFAEKHLGKTKKVQQQRTTDVIQPTRHP